MAVDPHAAGGQWPVDGGMRAVAAHRAAAVHATGDIPGYSRPKRPKRGPRLVDGQKRMQTGVPDQNKHKRRIRGANCRFQPSFSCYSIPTYTGLANISSVFKLKSVHTLQMLTTGTERWV